MLGALMEADGDEMYVTTSTGKSPTRSTPSAYVQSSSDVTMRWRTPCASRYQGPWGPGLELPPSVT
ncbi:hypothetical protein HMI49_27045 [Corallococcus exercitus]|uniref:Uncharacterized protein n=1 Tax=Corallococcus exercitus TaxID=2316736 RepID=A0A7Y4KPA7_9BACT|nr:hypothetical protein [Corallococcus exercitus]NOK36870.1 hypothetical protein [Corallococcus exercitus]